jgi:hypothetical protein
VIDFNALAEKVFEILKTFNYVVTEMYDEKGMEVIEPASARRFISTAKDVGVAIIENGENSELVAILSNSIDTSAISNFREMLLNLSNRTYGITFTMKGQKGEVRAKDLIKYNISEGSQQAMDLTENMYGTSRSSYLKLDNARLIVKHSGKVDEAMNGARSRKIDRMYVENARGERLLLPTKQLPAGKAMAQHVSHGGELTDDTGKKLCEMADDYQRLGEAIRHVRRNQSRLTEDAAALRDCAAKSRSGMRSIFERVHRNYQAGVDSMLAPTLYEASDDELTTARERVKNAMSCDDCQLDEAVVETVARHSFNFDKEPLEEKSGKEYTTVLDMKVDRDAWLAFAERSELEFKQSIPAVQDVDLKDPAAVERAIDSIASYVMDDTLSNLFSHCCGELASGKPQKLAQRIAVRAVKIAQDRVLTETMRNPIIKEHLDWLESFTVENILLGENETPGEDDINKDEDELNKDDILLPKSKDGDLKRQVIKRPTNTMGTSPSSK